MTQEEKIWTLACNIAHFLAKRNYSETYKFVANKETLQVKPYRGLANIPNGFEYCEIVDGDLDTINRAATEIITGEEVELW